MKKIIFLFVISSLFLSTSCDDDTVLNDTSTVTLNFKAVYGGEPLVFQNSAFSYDYPQGNKIKFSDLKFFLAEVALLEEEDGEETELTDIQFVNFSNNTTLSEAQTPVGITLEKIPSGKFKALRIGIGVPPDLNNEDFTQYGANHPLRKNAGEYWSGWDSFIFMKINGDYDLGGDGLNVGTDASIGHHLGGNQFYQTITLDKAVVLETGKTTTLDIEIDLKELYLNQSGTPLDLTNPDNWATHDPGKVDAISFLTNNYGRAFKLK